MLRVVDHNYFKRIGALEFTIAHDDGQNPEDLTKADIVLLGVSRSSKTPLSIYLAQQGLRVANVPLDPTTEPPSQIYDVDRTRLFGLMITPEVLLDIRRQAHQEGGGEGRGGRSPCSRRTTPIRSTSTATWRPVGALMRRLGCIVVHTEGRAVEETAQEILRYYERSHPSNTDIID